MLFRCQFHFIWFGSCSKYLPVCESFIWHKHESFCKMWAAHFVLRNSCLSGRYRSHAQNCKTAPTGQSQSCFSTPSPALLQGAFAKRSFACSRSAPPVKCLYRRSNEKYLWQVGGQRWGQSGDCRRSGWAVTFPVTACCLLKGKLKRGRALFFFFLFFIHFFFYFAPAVCSASCHLSGNSGTFTAWLAAWINAAYPQRGVGGIRETTTSWAATQ